MTRRRLRPEEIALWQKVVENTERLDGRPVPTVNPIDGKTATPSPPKRAQIAAWTPPGPGRSSDTAPLAMDRKRFARMKRGKLAPEARIDLHGMTLDRAHPALTRFILGAQAKGRRLVLVITGKGRGGKDEDGPMPVQRGVLRRQVPLWLRQSPLGQAVLQIEPAHVSHGGEGAFYVYLRKPGGR